MLCTRHQLCVRHFVCYSTDAVPLLVELLLLDLGLKKRVICLIWSTSSGTDAVLEHLLLEYIGGSSRGIELVQPRQHLLLPGPTGVTTHEALVPSLAGRVVLPHPL
jgi:hypothetical protein